MFRSRAEDIRGHTRIGEAPNRGPTEGIASSLEVLRAVQNGRNLFVRKDLWKQVVPETRLGESEYSKISRMAEAPSPSTARAFSGKLLVVGHGPHRSA